MENKKTLFSNIKDIIIGKGKNLHDSTLFHKLSLIAFFAWVGLGADGLSSSCYGPQEAYLALGGHTYLSIFVAICTVITIFVITASYSQIVELFPGGGGGYAVASKLLSPSVGMVAGSALLIDYVLTITVSIASGADAVFSLLPMEWHSLKLPFALFAVVVMIILNMRGVKESVLPLVPIFLTFVVTHIFIIIYAVCTHVPDIVPLAGSTSADISSAVSQLGVLGTVMLILKAYTMGAGTYTGIEAVSNSVPILREPKVETAKKTMQYMAVSLAFISLGLMVSYLFYKVGPVSGKTMNAIFFESATASWGVNNAYVFVFVALISEVALLFVGAQAGFFGGPRVLANMALDRWFPTRFSTLSDRLVIQNGILIIGGLAFAMMVLTHGSVRMLVVLYSINVFITFVLSQLGMVKHCWQSRARLKDWGKKLMVNGTGLILSSFILVSMIFIKFDEGGWITLVITGAFVMVAIVIKRHYIRIAKLLRRLNPLVAAAMESERALPMPDAPSDFDPKGAVDSETKTAVLLVSGFNGMGLHVLLNVMRLFGSAFKNFIFIQIGVVDAGNFKGAQEVDNLKADSETGVKKYITFMNNHGYHAEGIASVGVNIVDEVSNLAPKIIERFPNSVFFGGQLIFEKDSAVSRIFHNYTVFTLQKRLYRENIPFVILPVRV